MYSLLRKALFIADPETAHGLALEGLRLGHGVGATSLLCKSVSEPVSAMGLSFPNAVGMAAGIGLVLMPFGACIAAFYHRKQPVPGVRFRPRGLQPVAWSTAPVDSSP